MRRRVRPRLALTAAAAASALLLAACGGTAPVPIVSVATEPSDPLALVVSAGACQRGPYKVVVRETSRQVHVALSARRAYGQNEAACSDGVMVRLHEPLGSRSVLDDSTGDVVGLPRN